MTTPTFFWHDYETFGSDPRRDRPAQFAGLRTSFDLEPIGDPVEFYCQPSDDYLPNPEAVAITAISPQIAAARGLIEAEFVVRIQALLGAPGTCGVGYNNLRFDDELTRHLLWRNLWPPYDREWRDDCSRWDVIDMVRACHALRPEGIHWPRREDGAVSFRLSDLTAANGLAHEQAHDALSDVRATIALARLIKTRQPRLFAHCLKLRHKAEVTKEIGPLGRPFLHVSSRFGAARHHVALVAVLAPHPSNRNELLVWDLAQDPAQLADLSADTIRRRLFTPAADLAEGETRLPIKSIHINRSPMVAGDLRVLDGNRAEALGLDLALAQRHAARLPDPGSLRERFAAVYEKNREGLALPADPDAALYDGFLGDGDARQLARLRGLDPVALAAARPRFDDPRLPELVFRYRARNWPDSLTPEEQQLWQQHRQQRLIDGCPGYLNLAQFEAKLAEVRHKLAGSSRHDPNILNDLNTQNDGGSLGDLDIMRALDELASHAAALKNTLPP